MKKQTTDWIFTAEYAQNTYIRTGYIHNKKTEPTDDVVRFQIKNNLGQLLDYACTIDEAACLACGLMKIVTLMLTETKPMIWDATEKTQKTLVQVWKTAKV